MVDALRGPPSAPAPCSARPTLPPRSRSHEAAACIRPATCDRNSPTPIGTAHLPFKGWNRNRTARPANPPTIPRGGIRRQGTCPRRRMLHRPIPRAEPTAACHLTFKSLGQKCRLKSSLFRRGGRMTDITLNSSICDGGRLQPASWPNLDKGFNPLTMILFFGILAAGLLYVAYSIYADIDATGMRVTAYLPYLLLFVALLIALGFEFVNGFHDTANAVATVIYTHSLPAEFAVMWSGFFNFLGVLLSSGAVAFGIVSLLPVELILQGGSSAGFAMVFALLIAAIIWNLGTWYFGLPASSSHTLIGSVIGVGLANQFMAVKTATSGVDWKQASNIGKSLLLSPMIGCAVAALLLVTLRAVVNSKHLLS